MNRNKQIILDFIEEIWNHNQFHHLEDFLHQNFRDHSLSHPFTADRSGLQMWIEATGRAFEHKTIVEQIVAEEEHVIVKIKFQLKHIGVWRDIQPTGLEVDVVGYRSFMLLDGKILEHWALVDGNSIENQLREVFHGCKIQN